MENGIKQLPETVKQSPVFNTFESVFSASNDKEEPLTALPSLEVSHPPFSERGRTKSTGSFQYHETKFSLFHLSSNFLI